MSDDSSTPAPPNPESPEPIPGSKTSLSVTDARGSWVLSAMRRAMVGRLGDLRRRLRAAGGGYAGEPQASRRCSLVLKRLARQRGVLGGGGSDFDAVAWRHQWRQDSRAEMGQAAAPQWRARCRNRRRTAAPPRRSRPWRHLARQDGCPARNAASPSPPEDERAGRRCPPLCAFSRVRPSSAHGHRSTLAAPRQNGRI
jgi:hypothetical protein